MKFHVKLLLGLCAVGVLCGVYYFEEWYTEKEKKEERQKNFVFNYDVDDVEKITLKNSNGMFEFLRVQLNHDPDGWVLKKPISVNADKAFVKDLLSNFLSLRIQKHLEVPENYNVDSFKEKLGILDSESYSVSFSLKDSKTLDIEFGMPVKIGKDSSLSMYGYSSSNKAFYVLSKAQAGSFSKSTLSDLRDKHISFFRIPDVSTLEVLKSGRKALVVQKTNADWDITTPHYAIADSVNVNIALQKLQNLKAVKIFDGDKALNALAKKAKNTKVILKDKDGNVLQKFYIFKKDKTYYASLSDNSVGSLSESSEAFVPSFDDLRDKLVMRSINMSEVSKMTFILGDKKASYAKIDSKWQKQSDTHKSSDDSQNSGDDDQNVLSLFNDFEFMTANRIIDHVPLKALALYGLNKPNSSIVFELSSDEDAPKKMIKIFIGKKFGKDKNRVYIRRDDKDSVYVVDSSWLNTFSDILGK